VTGGDWKAFQLVPHDVLFFRDGKPSTRGADHYLRSLFPPRPSTLYGAVRTRRLLDGGVDLTKLNKESWSERVNGLEPELGPWGGFGNLEIRGPWLVRNREPLAPAPADLGVVLAGGEEIPRIEKVVRFHPLTSKERRWSHPLNLLTSREAGGDEPDSAAGDWFLTPAGLQAWRRGGVPEPADFIHRKTLWKDEPRTGVGLEAGRRTHAEGLLYTFGFIRLERDVALGFEARETELDAGGAVRLGGEGRTAALEAGAPFHGDGAEAAARFSLCFLTPSLSETGGYPPGFAYDKDNREVRGELAERPCRLVAAALPRFTFVGGWDLATGAPKPLRRAIPPGSVFLFETLDGGAMPLLEIDGHCFSDYPGEHLKEQGFGLAMAGVSG
jgi:CRISPR-associated protein Cmr3